TPAGRHRPARAGAGRRVDRHWPAGNHGKCGTIRRGRRRTAAGRRQFAAEHPRRIGKERHVTSTLSPSLERSMDAFRSAMQAAVARMDPSSAAVSAYHLGWSAADGTPLQAPSGKGIRPTLALLSAQAGGAEAEAGIPAAVAVELVH